MIGIIVAIHVIVCLTLVTVVLLQQGKGADVGAVFGGSSSTTFGSSGAGNALTKVTWTCAIIFFATSIFLAYASTRRVSGSIFEGGHIPVKTLPAGKLAVPPIPSSKAPATGPKVNPAAPAAPAGPSR